MAQKDPRVDAYIAKSPDFARPILTFLRRVVYDASPDIEETMKWNTPSFMYKGMLCGMAAFKAHCMFGFWKGRLVLGDKATVVARQLRSLTKVSDLPSKSVLRGYIRKAMALNDAGIRPARATRPPKKLVVPVELTAALERRKKAQKAFEAFSPSHRREYAEWIAGAKGEDTRARRLKTAIAWIAEGKPRNWKYQG